MAKPSIKHVKTAEDAWQAQETYKGKPHGWLQWKGTDVCMDVYCICGRHSHIDCDFTYNIKCPYCGRVYMVNGHVEFILIDEEPVGTKVPDGDEETINGEESEEKEQAETDISHRAETSSDGF